MHPVDCHRRQRDEATCVAACVCMVECSQGKAAREEDLVAGWARWGDAPYTLKLHAGPHLGHYEWLDPDIRANHDYIRRRLPARWLIVTLILQPRKMPHAVVLVEATTHGFRYLDPGEQPDGQPLEIGVDEFVQKWTGEVVIPDARSG